MIPDRPGKIGLHMIGYTELPGCFFDNGGDFPVVNMTDVREKVVFDLVIQSTDEPGKYTAFGREVSCCHHLVDGPGILQVPFLVGMGYADVGTTCADWKMMVRVNPPTKCMMKNRIRTHHHATGKTNIGMIRI